MFIVSLLAAPLFLTSVEVCVASPEPPAIEPPEWHWRMVDGRKCYFRADRLLPREDLFWEYDAEQLDMDEGAVVRSRKHYSPAELGAIGASRKELRARGDDDRSRPRKRMRRRRRDDDDDDDD